MGSIAGTERYMDALAGYPADPRIRETIAAMADQTATAIASYAILTGTVPPPTRDVEIAKSEQYIKACAEMLDAMIHSGHRGLLSQSESEDVVKRVRKAVWDGHQDAIPVLRQRLRWKAH